jgi:hypothetical protein
VEIWYLWLFHCRELLLCSLNSVDCCALAHCEKLCV